MPEKFIARDFYTLVPEGITPSGRVQIPTYSESYDIDGVYTVVENGSYNIQDMINSFADDVDVYKILRRVASGEQGLLDKNIGSYFDLTVLPKNLHEAHKSLVEAQLFFDRLPTDVRMQYNNNFRQFISDFGSDRFNSIFYKKPEVVDSDTPIYDKKDVIDNGTV